IDVASEEPAVFNRSTGRVLITEDTDETGAAMPYQGYGGVAYVGVWGYSNMQYYQPALVYFDNLGSGYPPFVSEASTHEAGHNLNLSHDGRDGENAEGYYYGHGSGYVSWAPIMGVGYDNNVTQWSRGEYTDANNQQDDLAILDGLLGARPDDHIDAVAGATALYVDGAGTISATNPETDPGNALTDNKGVIENSDDVDMFAFSAGPGLATLSVTPAWDAYYRSGRRGANLDVQAALYNEFGTLLAESDPTDDTDAYIAMTLSGVQYYLAVTGVGNSGVPYSDYGSLGQYFIAGQIVVDAGDPGDTVAPIPNPMAFAVAPAMTGTSSITMSAVNATDDLSAVEYQFQCVSGGGGCATSAWQSGKTHSPTGLDAHTPYDFVVRARDASGNMTALSSSASATTDNSMPVAGNDSDGGVEDQIVVIAVLGNDSDPDGDTVLVTGASNGTNGLVTTTDSTVSYIPNSGFVGVDVFTYNVGDGFGGTASASVTVTITAAPSLPAAPTSPTATPESDGSVTVGWVDASDNETGFEVMRETKHKKRNQWNSNTVFGTTPTNAVSLSDSPSAATHRYRIRAVNLSGASAWTAWVEVTASSSGGDGGGGGGGGGSTKCHPRRGC
ncbi:MAG: cadherin-like domain-containing protein, partial [Alphaproteobacteria bacterium]